MFDKSYLAEFEWAPKVLKVARHDVHLSVSHPRVQSKPLLVARPVFCGARDIGRQLLGAFDDNFMCGLHSHIFGVLPEYRNPGAGHMLKMAQREDALARGIRARRSARMDADRQAGLTKPPQGSAKAGKD